MRCCVVKAGWKKNWRRVLLVKLRMVKMVIICMIRLVVGWVWLMCCLLVRVVGLLVMRRLVARRFRGMNLIRLILVVWFLVMVSGCIGRICVRVLCMCVKVVWVRRGCLLVVRSIGRRRRMAGTRFIPKALGEGRACTGLMRKRGTRVQLVAPSAGVEGVMESVRVKMAKMCISSPSGVLAGASSEWRAAPVKAKP